MKLAPKLTILFLLLSILPTAIVGYFAYENGRRTIVQETIDHLLSINIFKNNDLKRWIEDNKGGIEELAQQSLVRQYAEELVKHDTPNHAYHKAKKSIIENHLKPRLKYGGFFELFLMCPRHGLISASTDEKQEGKYSDTYPYFIEGKSRTHIQGIYYSPTLEQPAMTMSTPIKDKQGNLMGVLGGHLDLEELSKIIGLQTGKSPTEDTYLVNTFNFFVTEPRFGQGYMLKKAIRTEGVEAGLSGKDGVGFYKDYRGVPVIGAYKWLPEFKMCIITEMGQAEAFAPIVHLAWVIAGIASAISIGVSLLGLFFARTITRPVQQLAAGAEEIGGGNLEHRVGTTSKDEIGELSRAFDRMTEALADKESQLLKEQARLQFLLSATPAVIYASKTSGDYGATFISENVREQLGYEPKEFIEDSSFWANHIHPDDAQRIFAELPHLFEHGHHIHEYRFLCKDGTYKWIFDEMKLVRDETSNPLEVAGYLIDITQRKQAEEALRESEEKFRSIVDNVGIGVSLISPKMEILSINNQMKMWFPEIDVSKKPICYRTFNYPPREEICSYCPTCKTLQDGEIHESITETPLGDEIRNYRIVSSPLRDQDGKVFAAIEMVEDITERRRAEEELTRYREHLEEMVKRQTTALRRSGEELLMRNKIANIFLTATTDEEISGELLNVILEVMESKYGVVGYIDEDGAFIVPSMTRHIWDKCQVPDKTFIFPRDKWGHSSWPRAIRENKTNYTNEASILTPEGHINITRHISMPIIFQGEVIGLIQVANKETDYTEEDVQLLESLGNTIIAPILNVRLQKNREELSRKRAEEEIRKLNAELEQRVLERTVELEVANKELEAFSYSVSHDLRAPLRAIDGFSRIILEDYLDKLDDEGKRFLNTIRHNTQKMGQLIDDLLLFSRLGRQEIKVSEMDMGKLISSTFKELKLSAPERKIELNIKALPSSQGDSSMIRQVFVNLLNNAIKFTRPKDTATIEVGGSEEKTESIYYVRDNGVGFDMQYAGKLFGVFQRLHSASEFEGTGVGLAIVQRIIHRHGGRVWAEGEVGKGATFFFTLPRKEG